MIFLIALYQINGHLLFKQNLQNLTLYFCQIENQVCKLFPLQHQCLNIYEFSYAYWAYKIQSRWASQS